MSKTNPERDPDRELTDEEILESLGRSMEE